MMTATPSTSRTTPRRRRRKKIVDAYVSQKLDVLDFNDMIGDMPTRFHYMPVEPTSYGLTPAEILLADDADLNTYVGLKKIAPYRRNGKKVSKNKNGEPWDPRGQKNCGELREKLQEKQKKLGINLNEQQPQEKDEGKPKKEDGAKRSGRSANWPPWLWTKVRWRTGKLMQIRLG